MATKYANCADDVTGNENIAEMWKTHFIACTTGCRDIAYCLVGYFIF